MKNLNKVVVYDIEVRQGPNTVKGGWNNPYGMGFASAVVWDYQKGRYFFYLHDPNPLIGHLTNRVVVSFNGVKFDAKVLLGNDYKGAPWTDYDILQEYVKVRYGFPSVVEAEEALGDDKVHDGTFNLDSLSQHTLGRGKIGSGAKAPELYQMGDYASLLEYNLEDVRLTRDLFDFIRRYGYVVDGRGQALNLGPMRR